MQNRRCLSGTLFIFGLLGVSAAQAHDIATQTATLSAGFSHPLSGCDHLLAALAVGRWVGQQNGPSPWRLPVVFLSTMAVGAAAGTTGLPLPGIELVIAISVLLLGLLLAFAVRLPLAVGTTLAGVFALFHGLSHGVEMTTQVPAAATYMAGLLLATALLQVIGVKLGRRCMNAPRADLLLRVGGGAIAATGALAWV